MRRTGAAWLVAVGLVLAACGGSADDETSVLGISVERTDDGPSAGATSDPADDVSPEASVAPSETATEQPGPSPSPSPEPEPAADPTSEPSARPSPEPPPPSPDPSPEPSPTPEPAVLGDADSGGFSRWTPHTDPPEECCWIELGGSGPITRDPAPEDTAVRGDLLDPVPAAEGEPEPWQRQVRQATCQGWIEAPSDRGLRATGTATVEVTYGGAVLTSGSYAVDVELAPGERHLLAVPDAGTVDAAADQPVTCTVRFVAG